MEMNVDVNKLSPQTHKYWHYIIGKIVKPSPIHAHDTARFSISEDSPYFPEFTERPVVMNIMKLERRFDKNNKVHLVARRVSPLEQEVNQAHDEAAVRQGKIDGIMWFTERKLDGMCTLRSADISDDGPIKIKFVFKILDSIKIYREANRLGIKVLRGKNLSKYYTEFPSEWVAAQKVIRWGPAEIDLSDMPLAVRICDEAYKQTAGQFVDFHDIAEILDRAGTESEKSMRDSIRSAINRLNEAAKKQTGKSLFSWKTNGFIRNA